MYVFQAVLLLASLAALVSPVLAQDGQAGSNFTSPGDQVQQSNLGLAINFQYGRTLFAGESLDDRSRNSS